MSQEISYASRIPLEWQGKLPREVKKTTDPDRSLKGIMLKNPMRSKRNLQLGRTKPQK